MQDKTRILIGVGLLFAAIAGVFVYTLVNPSTPVDSSGAPVAPPTEIEVSGYMGGEKETLMRDPEVLSILRDKYKIMAVRARKAGSIEMVRDIPLTDKDDFVWPATAVSRTLYQERGGVYTGVDNMFNSPMVFFSRALVVDALERENIVKKEGDTYYLVDLPRLVQMIQNGKKWSDLGLPQLNGRISIRTTAPAASSSGNMFAALLASTLNGGDVPDEGQIDKLLPSIKSFFSRLGLMETSSADIFQQYITTGVGARPIVAGYEAQLLEYALSHPEEFRSGGALRKELRILYPRPTVWSSHPFIARTKNGKRLMEALKDQRIQEIAWKRHGFRPGLPGMVPDPQVIPLSGVPASIDSIIDHPAPRVMDKILDVVSPTGRP